MHQRCLDGFEPFGVALDKRGVDPVFLQHLSTEPTKERLISTQTHGKMKVGQFRPVSDQTADSLRVLEADQPCFRKRVYGDDMGAAPFHFFQRRQHAGVVGTGVLANYDDKVGHIKVFKGDRAFPDADGLLQSDARRFMAHIGAVGQIVRPEGTRQQLIGERRLVTRAARRVEDRLVR